MGLMRFSVQDRDRIADSELSRVYIAGPDEIPYHGRAYFSGAELLVERREDASGCLCVPWVLEEHGPWMINTTTLMERQRPYQLEVELARGLVFRVRNQMAGWEMLGLRPPEPLRAKVREATTAFARCATRQADPKDAAQHAKAALSLAADAAVRLAEVYSEQALAVRLAVTPRLPTLMGARVFEAPEPDDPLEGICTIVTAPCGWKAIEPDEGNRRWKAVDGAIQWAQSKGARVCAGPLLEFDERQAPEWAYLWEGDVDALVGLMMGHVEAVVKRYRGRVNLWNVAGRVNRSRVLGLSDEQRLQLVARAVRTVRELDPKTPLVVSFDQPWGESMASDATDLAPIDFADALERADLGIAGFGLELNMGYTPTGSTPRSPLALSQLLDTWSVRLEVPLLVTLSVPSGTGPDALADPKTNVLGAGSKSAGAGRLFSPESQAEWVRRYLPVLLAKSCVQVILWSQHRDDQPHELPHGGLIDGAGAEKPALAALRELREKYLN